VSSASLIQGLRHARVLVLHPQDRDSDELARQLKRIGCHVDLTWPPPASVPDGIDVIYFLLDSDQASRRSWRSGDLRAALIAVIDFENPTILKELLDSNAHGVLVRPIRPAGVLSTLVLALSNRNYETRLLGKVAKLEETLKARREIERATRIIMKLRGLSESHAYEFIRRQATAKRISTAAIATSIIHAQNILSELDGSG
jgi:AmiR/NasT family two-component response regulator